MSDSFLVPLRDLVLVSKEDVKQTSPGGLFIVPAAEDKIVSGSVLAVGSGKVSAEGKSLPLEVQVGDKVLFNKNFATEVKLNSDSFYLIREDQLLAFVR
jgi:chaperonin GroES